MAVRTSAAHETRHRDARRVHAHAAARPSRSATPDSASGVVTLPDRAVPAVLAWRSKSTAKTKVVERAYERVGDAVARGTWKSDSSRLSELQPRCLVITIVGPLPERRAAEYTHYFSRGPSRKACHERRRGNGRLIANSSRRPRSQPLVRQTGLELRFLAQLA
jgi:hypothetical protein